MTDLSPQLGPAAAFAGRRVLVTGHTGFKGSWLSLWLAAAGADVTGLALEPPTEPSMFEVCTLADRVDSHIVDVRDLSSVMDLLASARPELVFHMAAQPIVRIGYREPVETFATNVMGTVNVLEACRHVDSVKAAVVITSDKCYQNRESERGYCEVDALGGHDPYSASKACTEHVAAAYALSYFGSASHEGRDTRLATARAGNVIGGGDWAEDRLLPDAARALARSESVAVRNPDAVRPWQHVLEPLRGYLMLASHLLGQDAGFGGAWNFGPDAEGITPVREVMDRFCVAWGGGHWHVLDPDHPQPHETTLLTLDSGKARSGLEWRPLLGLSEALALTAEWYNAYYAGQDMTAFSTAQLVAFNKLADATGG